jgi:phosphoribosylformimino-5-aminoimidazole carboxamide ribotide isomerase
MIRIIPAIDIIDGKCVRLTRGDYSTRVTYDEDPVRIARKFEDAGIQYLHLVDLDGARIKKPANLNVLQAICRRTSLKIDFGGGIRELSDIEQVFSLGAAQITAGSIAVKNPLLTLEWMDHFGPDRIILGADVAGKMLAVSGWTENTNIDVFLFLKSFVEKGFRYVICTQVLRDGAFTGPDLTLYKKIKNLFPEVFLIASGGVSSITDVRMLDESHIDGVIIGKALYENKIKLTELESFIC